MPRIPGTTRKRKRKSAVVDEEWGQWENPLETKSSQQRSYFQLELDKLTDEKHRYESELSALLQQNSEESLDRAQKAQIKILECKIRDSEISIDHLEQKYRVFEEKMNLNIVLENTNDDGHIVKNEETMEFVKRPKLFHQNGGKITKQKSQSSLCVEELSSCDEVLQYWGTSSCDNQIVEHVRGDDLCFVCQVPMTMFGSKSVLVCPQCARSRMYLQSTSNRLLFDERIEYSTFAYHRLGHFIEWITHVQAKESTVVPEEIIYQVMHYLYDELGIRDYTEINWVNVKLSMRKLGINRKWHNHAPQVCTRITGITPPRMTPFQENQLILMFESIQIPFYHHLPPEKNNFPSYGQCLFKFCELLGWDIFLPLFPLLSGDSKLKDHDKIFEAIYKDVNWTFIPTERLSPERLEYLQTLWRTYYEDSV